MTSSKEGEEKDGGRRFTHRYDAGWINRQLQTYKKTRYKTREVDRADTQNQKKQGKKYNAKLQRLCEETQKEKERERSGLSATELGGAGNLRD